MKTLQEFLNESFSYFDLSAVPAKVKKELKGRDIDEWVRTFNNLGKCFDDDDVRYYKNADFWPKWEKLFKSIKNAKINDSELLEYIDFYFDSDMQPELWEFLDGSENDILKDIISWQKNK